MAPAVQLEYAGMSERYRSVEAAREVREVERDWTRRVVAEEWRAGIRDSRTWDVELKR